MGEKNIHLLSILRCFAGLNVLLMKIFYSEDLELADSDIEKQLWTRTSVPSLHVHILMHLPTAYLSISTSYFFFYLRSFLGKS